MMTMKTRLASGAASAHRYDLAPSTPIFKTRIEPCRIAVRADTEKSMKLRAPQICFGCKWTITAATQIQIHSLGSAPLRFTDDCPLKTANSQRSSALRFPYGTSRRNTTGFLEQRP